MTAVTLFSPARTLWPKIVKEIKKNFNCKEVFIAKYSKKSWHRYFSSFYSIDDNANLNNSRIKRKGKLIKKFGTDMLVAILFDAQEQNLSKFKKNIRKKIKEELRGRVQIVEKIERKPRHIINKKLEEALQKSVFPLKDLPGIENNIFRNNNERYSLITPVSSWLIIHAFKKGKNSTQAINFIKKNCDIDVQFS